MNTITKIHCLIAIPYLWIMGWILVGYFSQHWMLLDIIGAGAVASIIHAFCQIIAINELSEEGIGKKGEVHSSNR